MYRSRRILFIAVLTLLGSGITQTATVALSASSSSPVDLSGIIKSTSGQDICAVVLANGQLMFSCNPKGAFSLTGLPRASDGTVTRQIYARGFLPKIDTFTDSVNETVVLTPSGSCPSYNTAYNPGLNPGSAGRWIDIAGNVLLQDTQTPVCAMVLANGQHMFSCDGTGSYTMRIPLDNNGQYTLQVYANGFAPTIQTFDEFSTNNVVKMARAAECQGGSSASSSVRISICQQEAKDHDISGNLARMSSCVATAAADGGEIVVFPELVDVGFGSIVLASTGAELAQPIPGATTNAIGQMAIDHGVWIAASVLEQTATGVYDTAVLIDDQGKVALKQRKGFVYPVFGGAAAFQGNLHDLQVVDSPWGRIGMMNCVETSFESKRAVLIKEEPDLVLLVFANPQANLLDNAIPLALDTGAPVVGTNMYMPGNPGGEGGKSRFVLAQGQVLWQAPAGSAVMQSWDLTIAPRWNRAPRVQAGDTQTIPVSVGTVALNGYVSDDGRPGPVTTTWRKVKGPGTVMFTDPGAVSTNAMFSTPGVYTLELRADDGNQARSSKVKINIMADSGADPDWVGYWPFDNSAADQQLGNNGVLNGNPFYTTDVAPAAVGINTHSLDLDGAGDFVQVAHHASLNAPDGSTISMWVKPRTYPGFLPNGNDWAALLSKGSTWSDENYSLGFGAYYYLFGRGAGTLVPSLDDAVRSPNNWYHVAAVVEPANQHAKIYINGVLDQRVINTATVGTNSNDLFIGRYELNGITIDGRIDDVRLYTRALSDAEIAALVPGATINAGPDVEAGQQIQVQFPNVASLSGTVSDFSGPSTGNVARWNAWRKLSGPGRVTFNDRYSAQTSATFSLPGRYTLELRASDGAYLAYDSVEVIVKP